MLRNLLLLVSSVLLAFGCKQGSKSTAKQFNGYAVWEEGFTTFTDCNTGKEYWLKDATGELAKQLKEVAKEAYQPVFVVLEGDLLPPSTVGVEASYDNLMNVKKVVAVHAEAPKEACKVKTGNAVFDCSGEGWELGFGQDIKFTAKMPNDTLVFFSLTQPEARDSAGAGRIFYTRAVNENFQDIQIIITEKPCKTPLGKISRFSAKVLFGGVIFEGCAKLKTSQIPDEQNTTTGHNSGRGRDGRL
jgi:copper homeostasis protein (lipoprotein)